MLLGALAATRSGRKQGSGSLSRRFRGLREKPNPSYDAIIIGAGVGGLICANLLTRAGLKVLLIEQHYMVGGYCSTFRRAGYTFDAATISILSSATRRRSPAGSWQSSE